MSLVLSVITAAIAWLCAPALGADCAPLDEATVRDRVSNAKAAVDRDDLVGFAETRRALFTDLACLDIPLPVDAWARFLLDEAVVAYALAEPWQPPLATALALDPDLPRGDLPEALRDWVPAPPTAAPGDPLASGAFLVDGQPVESAPALTGVHVVQRLADGRWSTRVLRDEPFPADWRVEVAPVPVATAPVRRSRGSPALIGVGLGVAAVGAAIGAGTWAARGGVVDPGAGDRLVLANVAGWSAAGLGVALGVVGLAAPGPVRTDAEARVPPVRAAFTLALELR